MPFLLAQTILELSPPEVIFFKILALLVMCLWAVYLIKEIFHSNREDPRLASIISAQQQSAIQLAVLATNMENLAKAQGSQKDREEKLWDQIGAIGRTLTTLIKDQSLLEGATIAARHNLRDGLLPH